MTISWVSGFPSLHFLLNITYFFHKFQYFTCIIRVRMCIKIMGASISCLALNRRKIFHSQVVFSQTLLIFTRFLSRLGPFPFNNRTIKYMCVGPYHHFYSCFIYILYTYIYISLTWIVDASMSPLAPCTSDSSCWLLPNIFTPTCLLPEQRHFPHWPYQTFWVDFESLCFLACVESWRGNEILDFPLPVFNAEAQCRFRYSSGSWSISDGFGCIFFQYALFLFHFTKIL